MFTFVHTYNDESYAGLLKHGMLRAGDGLKVMQTNYKADPFLFNNRAAIGSPLDKILTELRCPFYIDRYQGGVGLPFLYKYDPAILRHLYNILGDNFWGFQMHEWSSNYRSDYHRIREHYQKCGFPDPTPEQRHTIWKALRENPHALFLEALTPYEWSSRRDPINRAMFIDDIHNLYEARSQTTGFSLIPADSYHMAPRIEIANGCRLLLPEVGWQIPNMRMQMAYTRGMANAASIRFGIYYECWCYNHAVENLTIPFSLRDGQDEWGEDQLTTGIGAERTPEERELGGTSRNLQERLWRYAYHSGATVLGEEYGVCNTFRDYHDFDLSVYGQTKRSFLSYLDRHTDPGVPFAPIAVVLPANLPILDVCLRDNYLDYPGDDASFPVSNEYTARLRSCMQKLFGYDGRGNTGHVIRCGGFPDVFDILHADQDAALAKYDYLIDLTDDASFAKAHSGVITTDDLDAILDTMLPCRIGEGLHTAYNKTAGGYTVLVLNNDGVTNDNFEGDTYMADAEVTAPVRFLGDHSTCRVIDGTGTLHADGDAYSVTLGAGQWLLLGID